ncbi:MAG: glycosyltransferase family 2 protein [Lewinella sp.]|nr:glycosyltransferase family 2 protein [Lewinella sp.]
MVIAALPRQLIRHIVVCNNNSKDGTAAAALKAGALVVNEARPGYGAACLAGLARLRLDPPDVVVFLDGDYSDYPEQLPELLAPIREQGMDLVIGSRALGQAEPGSMQPQQRFGNWLATNLIRLIYGYSFTDLGPFRAVRWPALETLGMQDQDFGWTVEMQIRAAKQKLRCTEVPVRYRRRVGKSKISGTVKGTLRAGHKILWTIFKLR